MLLKPAEIEEQQWQQAEKDNTPDLDDHQLEGGEQ